MKCHIHQKIIFGTASTQKTLEAIFSLLCLQINFKKKKEEEEQKKPTEPQLLLFWEE